MSDLTSENVRLECLRRSAHRLVALSDRHHREAVSLKLCRDLRRVPWIMSDLFDLIVLSELSDRVSDDVVVDDVARRSVQ